MRLRGEVSKHSAYCCCTSQSALFNAQNQNLRGVQDATELVAKLRAYHYTAQTKPDKAHYQHYGLDLEQSAVRNNIEAGVLEAAMSKTKIIQVPTPLVAALPRWQAQLAGCLLASRLPWLLLAATPS